MPTDPIERIVAEALTRANIPFKIGQETGELDFDLPTLNAKIECKQFYSERIAKQLSQNPNVIVIQGKLAALAFATMIAGDES